MVHASGGASPADGHLRMHTNFFLSFFWVVCGMVKRGTLFTREKDPTKFILNYEVTRLKYSGVDFRGYILCVCFLFTY